jgi:hypothetical protein
MEKQQVLHCNAELAGLNSNAEVGGATL